MIRKVALATILLTSVAVVAPPDSVVRATSYSYSFDANGGGAAQGYNEPTGGTATVGDSPIGGLGCVRTWRTGYVLAGWRASYNGTLFNTPCSVDGSPAYKLTGSVMPAQNVVFTAEWTLNITYDSNGGGTVSGGSTTTVSGGTISTLPTNPTRTNYIFDGWWTAPVGGTQITTSAAHNQTSHFTLYAQWVGYYAFSFDPNGGPNTPAGGS